MCLLYVGLGWLNHMDKKVVISGISLLSPLGINFTENFNNLVNSPNCFKEVRGFDTKEFSTKLAGEIESLIGREDKFIYIFDKLMDEVLVDSNFNKKRLNEVVLSLGSSFLGIEAKLSNKIDHYIDKIKKKHNFKNIFINSNTCAASNFAINTGYSLIKGGFCKYVVCGGIDILTKYLFAGFDSLRSLSSTTPKPFSNDRDGLMLNEGGALILLENWLSKPKKRYCEIVSFGASVDNSGVSGMDKSGMGIKKSILNAINSANICESDIDLISTHGTATILNDKVEGEVIQNIFGNKPLIYALKGYFGHTMGASSAIQVAILADLFVNEKLIKNSYLNNMSFKLNFVEKNCKKRINYAINNAFGFGGVNSSLLLKRVDCYNM